MAQVTTIGLDIAKHVFQAHGADAAGQVVFRKRITRGKLIAFLAAQSPCIVAMEACAGAHYWAREISKLGHSVRLMAPAYVKPFVKRQKNDAADAEAVCEAVQRPSMRFVPVKTEEQQANAIVFRARDLLVRQRTQCVNALRGHLMEYGYVFPKGITHVATLVALIEDLQSSLPDSVRVILKLLVDTFTALEAQITARMPGALQPRAPAGPGRRQNCDPVGGMPCLFLNTERGFGGKPPKKSGVSSASCGAKMPKEGSSMPKETFFAAISRRRRRTGHASINFRAQLGYGPRSSA